MATDHSSPESAPRKRQRRSKQDPHFVFENSTMPTTEGENVATSSTSSPGGETKRSPSKNKIKSVRSIDPAEDEAKPSNATGADLYEPGDVVWSKLGGFPWWPALIYGCPTENGIHTKALNANNPSKRQFFVYFYGKYLEYCWLSTRSLLKYSGLSNFIQHAEAAVQQASTKSEQQELANRFQLKVSMKKRVQWDEAIELADHALTMSKEERIKEFTDLLNGVQNNEHQSKNAKTTSDRRRRRSPSVDKSHVEHEDDDHEGAIPNKRRARASSASSNSSAPVSSSPTALDLSTAGKASRLSLSLRKPIAFAQNGTKPSSDTPPPPPPQTNNSKGSDQPEKKKRGRKSKAELNELASPKKKNNPLNLSVKMVPSASSPSKDKTFSASRDTRTSRRSTATNGSEIEYDFIPASKDDQISGRIDQQSSSSLFVALVQANIPPLSNYEQKQIVEGLLHHTKGKNFTFDEAQTFAINKAIEIVYENHNYRMVHVSPEWFYDSILLKYPSVVFKYRSWFEHVKTDTIPNGSDMIKLKQWQIALMLNAQLKVEQQQQQQQQEETTNGN